MKIKPIENYTDGDTRYLIFSSSIPTKDIYLFAYKLAIKTTTKVGDLIYRDGIYQLTLNKF